MGAAVSSDKQWAWMLLILTVSAVIVSILAFVLKYDAKNVRYNVPDDSLDEFKDVQNTQEAIDALSQIFNPKTITTLDNVSSITNPAGQPLSLKTKDGGIIAELLLEPNNDTIYTSGGAKLDLDNITCKLETKTTTKTTTNTTSLTLTDNNLNLACGEKATMNLGSVGNFNLTYSDIKFNGKGVTTIEYEFDADDVVTDTKTITLPTMDKNSMTVFPFEYQSITINSNNYKITTTTPKDGKLVFTCESVPEEGDITDLQKVRLYFL